MDTGKQRHPLTETLRRAFPVGSAPRSVFCARRSPPGDGSVLTRSSFRRRQAARCPGCDVSGQGFAAFGRTPRAAALLFAALLLSGHAMAQESTDVGAQGGPAVTTGPLTDDMAALLAPYLDPAVVGHPLFAAGLLLVVLLPLFGAILWFQGRRRLSSERDAEALTDQVEALRQTLETSRDGYLLWLPDQTEPIISRRLSVLLGLPQGTRSPFEDVLASLTKEDGARLGAAVGAVLNQGTPFSLSLKMRQGERLLAWSGLRLTDQDDAGGAAAVLWVSDMVEAQSSGLPAGTEDDSHPDPDALKRSALDALPEPIWIRDSDLALQGFNDAFTAALKNPDATTAEHPQGEDLAEGDTGREMRALAARSRAADRSLSARFHVVIAGTRRPVEVTETPFRLADHEDAAARFTVGFARDITALEEMESQLADETANRAVVLEHLSTAIAIFGPETRLHYHNPAFARLWRLEPAWLAEAQPSYGDFLDLLRDRRVLPEVADYPAFKAAEVDRFTSLIEPVEDLIHLPDGKTLRRIIAPQPGGGLLLTYEDVTDKLTLERSFNTLAAVQRETLDHLHEAVGVFGADGRLKLANPAFAMLWGDTAANVTSPPLLAEFLEFLRDRFADESSWRHHRFAVLTPPSQRTQHRGRVTITGGTVLDYACVPLPDGGVLLSYNDISDTARIEQALRERAQTLSAASMLRSDFIASLSYELRTPLTTIAGFSEMLSAEYHGSLNAQQIDYVQSISETASDLVSILDDIADLVTIEAGRAALDVDAFDLKEAVQAVLTLCRETTRRRAVSVELQCSPDIGWMVGDENRIRQILFHLVGSAIRSTPAGSRVMVSVAREPSETGDETVMLTVADQGGAKSARAFASGQGLIKGGSLAMLLVRRFAEMHGGSIVVSADVEVGASVICRLPSGRRAGTKANDGVEQGRDAIALPQQDQETERS